MTWTNGTTSCTPLPTWRLWADIWILERSAGRQHEGKPRVADLQGASWNKSMQLVSPPSLSPFNLQLTHWVQVHLRQHCRRCSIMSLASWCPPQHLVTKWSRLWQWYGTTSTGRCVQLQPAVAHPPSFSPLLTQYSIRHTPTELNVAHTALGFHLLGQCGHSSPTAITVVDAIHTPTTLGAVGAVLSHLHHYQGDQHAHSSQPPLLSVRLTLLPTSTCAAAALFLPQPIPHLLFHFHWRGSTYTAVWAPPPLSLLMKWPLMPLLPSSTSMWPGILPCSPPLTWPALLYRCWHNCRPHAVCPLPVSMQWHCPMSIFP